MSAKVLPYGVVILICLACVSAKPPRLQPRGASRVAIEGAYRDGLYIGTLSARDHMPVRVPVGRWSTARDRALFEAGYHLAYSETVKTR